MHMVSISDCGIRPPETPTDGSRRRKVMCALLGGMISNPVVPIPPSTWIMNVFEAVKLGYDLGVEEPIETRQIIGIGGFCRYGVTNQIVYVVGPNQETYRRWIDFVDSSFPVPDWLVLIGTKDDRG